jgi:predicted MPP superfamily phosphohydrolase
VGVHTLHPKDVIQREEFIPSLPSAAPAKQPMSRYFPIFLALSTSLLALLAAYCWWIEPARLAITEHAVADPDQPLAHPVRALLLTDWHLGCWSRQSVLKAKMHRLLRLHQSEPFDVVLLGGDYVDIEDEYLAQLVPALEILRQMGIPIFAVPGNHDYTTYGGDISPILRLLEGQGVKVLRNEAEPLTTIRGQRIQVIGLDDLQQSPDYFRESTYQSPEEYRKVASKILWYAQFDTLEPVTPRLLLSHNPDAVYMPGLKPLAVLSGHTHGGQLMLLDWLSRPLHRWLHTSLPPGSAVTWAGRRKVNGRALIVSRGIEGSALPLRLLRSPEAIVVTLT